MKDTKIRFSNLAQEERAKEFPGCGPVVNVQITAGRDIRFYDKSILVKVDGAQISFIDRHGRLIQCTMPYFVHDRVDVGTGPYTGPQK